MLVIIGSLGPALPASQLGVWREEVEVTVREVEVHVTDRQGNPVTDLGKRDFEVFEDGRRVKITNFAAIRRSPAPRVGIETAAEPGESSVAGPSSPALASDDRQRLFFVIYVDEVHIQPRNRDRVFAQLDEFLAAREAFDDRVMVVRYGRQLAVEQQFTRRAEDVSKSLERMRLRATAGVQTEAAWWSTVEDMRRLAEIPCNSPQEPVKDLCTCAKDRMIARAQEFAGSAFAEVDGSLRALGEVANSLAGLPGRKAILYVSDGLALRSGEALFTMIEEWCPFGTAPGNAVNEFPSTVAAYAGHGVSALDTLGRLTAHASRNGVTLHTFQASGLQAYSQARVDGDFTAPNLRTRQTNTVLIAQARRDNLQQPLNAIAADTGGLAFLGTNDVAWALRRIEQDSAFYYSLGYEPARKFDERNHSIKVRVKREGVRVRHRKTHRDLSVWEQAANRTVAALWHQVDYNPGRVEVAFGRGSEVDKSSHRLPLLIRIPMDTVQLVHNGESYVGQLSVFLAAQGESGRVPPAQRARLPIRVSAERYLLAYENQLEFPLTLTVEPGSSRLAIGVWDETSLRYSVFYRELAPGMTGGSTDGRLGTPAESE